MDLTLKEYIRDRILQGFSRAFPGEAWDPDITVADPSFGDYQASGAMALGKRLRRKPRAIAEAIVGEVDREGWAERIEVAGPGFINVRLDPVFLARTLTGWYVEESLGVRPARRRRYVIDFSSPNAAKPMHVGHIRSTVIGDALSRMLRHVGHEVITDNHIGDWGTVFGMLIVGYRTLRDDEALGKDPIAELARIYREIHARVEENEELAEECRGELRKLQAGDPENLALWERFMGYSRAEFVRVYDRLGVTFDHTLGESFYNPMLREVVDDLVRREIARESQGAKVVFFEDEGYEPMVVEKRDGAGLYATTDLAALRYRVETFRPDGIIYVTDSRQDLHFRQLFAVARRWGITGVGLEHIGFGTITGPDRKPLKTRSGDLVPLEALLDEAEERAVRLVEEKSPHLPAEERVEVARAVGIGAVKYQDLRQNIASDYVFSWEKMMAIDGESAPYLQYAHARNRSILRKGSVDPDAVREHPEPIRVEHPSEIVLGKLLCRWPETIHAAAAERKPNLLARYLYDLAVGFSGFYRDCPVLDSPEPVRASRLKLCDYTARVIREGLGLLGIQAIERM